VGTSPHPAFYTRPFQTVFRVNENCEIITGGSGSQESGETARSKMRTPVYGLDLVKLNFDARD